MKRIRRRRTLLLFEGTRAYARKIKIVIGESINLQNKEGKWQREKQLFQEVGYSGSVTGTVRTGGLILSDNNLPTKYPHQEALFIYNRKTTKISASYRRRSTSIGKHAALYLLPVNSPAWPLVSSPLSTKIGSVWSLLILQLLVILHD